MYTGGKKKRKEEEGVAVRIPKSGRTPCSGPEERGKNSFVAGVCLRKKFGGLGKKKSTQVRSMGLWGKGNNYTPPKDGGKKGGGRAKHQP